MHTTAVPDTISPTVGISVTSSGYTSLTVNAAAIDNVAVVKLDFYLNSSFYGTVYTSSSASYTFNGLLSATTYIPGVIATDATGNHSALITTIGITLTPVLTATIISIQNPCFIPLNSGGGYVWIDVYGTNFVDGATYQANYYDNHVWDGSPYNGTVVFINSTHIQVLCWVSYFYEVRYTVTNPGASTSNTWIIQVVDCGGWSGITEVTKDGAFSFKALSSNLVTSDYEFEINQQVTKETYCQYEVTNYLGQIMQAGNLSNGQNSVSFSNDAEGLYLLTIKYETSEGIRIGKVKKIVKL
jgi:hypothetical protein